MTTNLEILKKEVTKTYELEHNYDLKIIGKNYKGIKKSIESKDFGDSIIAADCFMAMCAVFEKDGFVVEGFYNSIVFGLSNALWVCSDKRIAHRSKDEVQDGLLTLMKNDFLIPASLLKEDNPISLGNIDFKQSNPLIHYSKKFLDYLRYDPIIIF
jgi:hypothetical protein